MANQCGSTAVVCLILGNKLVCANVGDARAILCRNGKAIDLSVDHKAVRNTSHPIIYSNSQEKMNRLESRNKEVILSLGEFWEDWQ